MRCRFTTWKPICSARRSASICGAALAFAAAIGTICAPSTAFGPPGSIAEAVRQGIVGGGVMAECVRAGIPYVLAGSIRDDGPLPETEMDLLAAQAAYAEQIDGADLILMLATMLHAIGVGNMTPAGVRLVCVDINPAVVTKLADRGSVESTGIVTDVGLFLGTLTSRLRG